VGGLSGVNQRGGQWLKSRHEIRTARLSPMITRTSTISIISFGTSFHQQTSTSSLQGSPASQSGAYSESSDGGMSVDVEDWIRADGLPTLHYFRDPYHGAVRPNVGMLRKLGLQVGWDPDGGHRHHGAVWGINSSRRRKIAAIAITSKKSLRTNIILLALVCRLGGT
jgi:hypothetical protein